eukprot:SAG31_NODE_3799_length_3870_cov_4.446036_2_plen_225_part_00
MTMATARMPRLGWARAARCAGSAPPPSLLCFRPRCRLLSWAPQCAVTRAAACARSRPHSASSPAAPSPSDAAAAVELPRLRPQLPSARPSAPTPLFACFRTRVLFCWHGRHTEAAWTIFRCAIANAEREDIERAARQTLRVIETEERLFTKAVLRKDADVKLLASINEKSQQRMEELISQSRGDRRAAGGGGGTKAESQMQVQIRALFRAVGRDLIERDSEVRA